MVTSNAPEDEMDDALPEWHEPFPEPQTIPSGWDLSGLQTDTSSATVELADSNAEE